MHIRRLLVLILFIAGISAVAQQPSSTDAIQGAPTTKVIALGHLSTPPTRDLLGGPLMQDEVRDTVRLYLAGKIDQWYVRKDLNGVVFVLNATSVEQARDILSALPLVKSQRMSFDFIPLGPLAPLSVLLRDSNGAQPQNR